MDKIIERYESNLNRYNSFSTMLESLLGSILLNNDVHPHSISSRVKKKESLTQKIERKGSYEDIEDITDVVGVRIITHYSDEVDIIAKIIEEEFDVDVDNSIDKRKSLEPDKFGYLSLHYIVALSRNRRELAENRHYKSFKAEIQIRSILQHTWAEIEHDTGYKSSIEVPYHIRRQFSRLAGLLEIADEQFINIKKSLVEYKQTVSSEIKENKQKIIDLNSISYREYVTSSEAVSLICDSIFSETHIKFEVKTNLRATSAVSYIRSSLRQLEYHGIKDVRALDEKVVEHKEFIVERIKRVINKRPEGKEGPVPIELLGVYLSQAIAAKDGDKNEIKKFIEFALVTATEERKKEFVTTLLSIHRKIAQKFREK
ncbi:GTP pyrophosphokinase [Pantoea agglomerans]|uniref:GTP pyrophosphokinase n=1 Tax=Enterobacter agglomerans TaxID=549 RepID=UPI00244A5672|nr:hypothetical protein [Pantoea agglomerans]MDH1168641.1 hypothetical protein [Pantoea agglomerans]